MSQQHLNTNPEFLLHYERLRRDRAMTRRRGYICLVAAGVLLASGFSFGDTVHLTKPATLVPVLLLFGSSILLLSNGLVGLRQSRQPIQDGEVTRRRQEERQQLFQFAQGHNTRRYWLTTAVQAFIGLIFLWFGIQGVWSLVAHLSSLNLLDMILSFAFLLIAWYSLSRAIGRARLLRRLEKHSSQELADRLSLGEATDGE